MSFHARPLWRPLALWLGLGFLYVPIGWIVVYSFSASTVAGVWKGFSLRWYAALLDNDGLRQAASLSLLLAALAATTATALGTIAGYALAHLPQFRGRAVMTGLLAIPLFVPEILIGFALLMLFVGLETLTGLRVSKGMLPLVAGHATMGMPVVASVVFARLRGLDHSFEEAALDLGARPLRVFLTVTLPLALPALASGWLLAFTLSFDDVITSSFLAGPANTTLPMLVYSTVRIGVSPQINVIGTLIIAGVALIVTAAMFRGGADAGLSPHRVRAADEPAD
jgi:putrescine transport system permease protein